MYNLIEVNNLNYSEGEVKILDNISFEIKKGDFTTFLCKESSGKTTLCNILSGIILTDSHVKIDNIVLNAKSSRFVRKKIAFLSENSDNIFIGDTVGEDINFYLKNKGLKKDQIETCLKKYSKTLGIDKILNQSSNRISQGQKQVVSFFLAVSSNPKILILDNAMSMINHDLKRRLILLLKQYNKMGMTVLNFTNNSEECFHGNEIAIFVDGKVLLKKATKDAFDNVKIFAENGLKLPFSIELSKKLGYYKLIDSVYFDYKKLVENIWK